MAAGKRTAAARGAWICFLDETGQSLRPPKGRTWAHRGRTPIVAVSARRSPRVAIIGLLCLRPGHRPRLLYRLRVHRGRRGEPKGVTPSDLTGLLRAAHHQLPGKITVVWDNLPAHHAALTRTFVEHHADWLDVAWLPAYAPELNPVESLWAYLKTGTLANLAAHGLDHLIHVIRTAIKRLQYRPDLLAGFLTGTGLQLEPPQLVTSRVQRQ
ncbi:transposase [Pseudofrankia sp. BMG5.36]|uniref:transposase n=2 Tax=Pseudofrankia sp. BMG5.36 TaxID=1834512 RepID=UPI0018E32BC8|nr:transposase [Pseudofrankia sp. BMG5.36]